MVLTLRESILAAFMNRNLHFSELGVGVPLNVYNFLNKGFPAKFWKSEAEETHTFPNFRGEP